MINITDGGHLASDADEGEDRMLVGALAVVCETLREAIRERGYEVEDTPLGARWRKVAQPYSILV